MKQKRVWSAAITMLLVAATTTGQTTRPGANRDKDPRYAIAWERASVVVQSRHYAIRSDLDADVTQALGVHLDRLSGEYARVLSGLRQRRKNNRLQVFLFRTRESYLATLALRFDADAEGTAGMTIRDGSKITMAAWQGDRGVIELKAVLRHEGFHQYREIFFPSMPPWVNEGIAELFERAIVLDDGILLGDVDPGSLRLLRDAAQRNRLIPFDRMFKMDSDDWQDHVNAGRGALNYAQAWAVVHFLIYGEGGRFVPTFERFLVLMNRGLSSQAAFQQAFGMQHLGPFADRWLVYLSTLEATDLAGTIVRLEYLAAGLLDLAEAGNEPETMAALQTALKENEFRYETSRFGIKDRLSFDNDAVFKPAGAAGDRGGATFVLGENRPQGGRSTARPKPGADGPVLPARAVFTRGLAPMDLGVIWVIDRRSGERSWQLIIDRSRPEARRR